jgi:16S rRNA (uracil1498-N3)-methyltransferase
MDGIVRRATELGVWEIHPIACRCGDGGLGAEKFANRTERWRTVAVSACRQSHNPFLPAVHPPQRLERVPLPSSAVKLAACLGEDALPWRELLRRFPENSVAGDLYLAVGPEGDFTGDEWAWLRAGGFSPVSLGPRILTAETAALALLSAAQLAWGE